MPAEIVAEVAGSYELPGAAVFPESIGVDGATGDAYVGSLADGSLYRLTGAGKAQVWGAGGQDGRGSVAGVKVDARGRLWAAGGNNGTLWVYDLATCALISRFATGTRPARPKEANGVSRTARLGARNRWQMSTRNPLDR